MNSEICFPNIHEKADLLRGVNLACRDHICLFLTINSVKSIRKLISYNPRTMNIPGDIWRCIFIYANGAPTRMVCRRWLKLAPKAILRASSIVVSIETARWAIENGCTADQVSVIATHLNRLDIIMWLDQAKYPWFTLKTCLLASSLGRREIVGYAYPISTPDQKDRFAMCLMAAINDHVEILEAYRCVCLWDSDARCLVYACTYNGCLRTLKWIWDHRIALGFNRSFTNDIPHIAAQRGHLDILRWLKSIGFEVGDLLVSMLVKYQTMDALQWMHKAKCLPDDIYSLAKSYKSTKVMEWAERKGYTVTSYDAYPIHSSEHFDEYAMGIINTIEEISCTIPMRAHTQHGRIIIALDWHPSGGWGNMIGTLHQH